MQQHWERVDGNDATREHLMMLLADIKSIRIKAKYAEETSETRLFNSCCSCLPKFYYSELVCN